MVAWVAQSHKEATSGNFLNGQNSDKGCNHESAHFAPMVVEGCLDGGRDMSYSEGKVRLGQFDIEDGEAESDTLGHGGKLQPTRAQTKQPSLGVAKS